MNVLVTGVTGFAGRHLVRAIADAGGRAIGASVESAVPPGLADLARYARWDVTEGADAGRAILEAGGVDAIVHLAGQASAARSFTDPAGTFRVNANGTLAVLEAARAADFAGSVVVVSSSEVYAPRAAGPPLRETDPVLPQSPYGASKAAAETLARAYHAAHGLRTVVARSFSHTGPGQAPAFALASWAAQIAGFEREADRGATGPFELRVGNLAPVRDYSDVRDVVRAYLVLAERGEAGGTYNVASGTPVALSDAVQFLAARARVPVEVVRDESRFRPTDTVYMVGDASRLAALGWSPRHDWKEALESLLNDARGRAHADTGA